MLRILFRILIVFFVSSQAFSQEPIKYTTKQGLPSNHVYCIRQDSKGFMWFGTNRGIAKYDGVSFRVFSTKDGLPNNDIWHFIPRFGSDFLIAVKNLKG